MVVLFLVGSVYVALSVDALTVSAVTTATVAPADPIDAGAAVFAAAAVTG